MYASTTTTTVADSDSLSQSITMYSSIKPNCRPPLPKSPIRLRSRRPLRSSDSTSLLQTPPGALAKSQKSLLRSPDLRPEYRTISCELRALAKMVRDEFGGSENVAAAANSCGAKNPNSLFERGRFYDEYSARRNERLKRKKGVAAVEEGNNITANKAKAAFGLGVNMESGKKSCTARKIGSLRKSVSAAYSMEVNETPRYMLRSMTKENKKPPLAAGKFDKSVIGGEKKMGARRVGRI